MPRTASLQAPDVVYLSVRFMQYTHSRATGLRHVLAYAGPRSLMPGGTPEAYQHIEPMCRLLLHRCSPPRTPPLLGGQHCYGCLQGLPVLLTSKDKGMDGEHELLYGLCLTAENLQGYKQDYCMWLAGQRWAMCDIRGPWRSRQLCKMVHNGIEYGDMQLISEAYDVLRTVGGLSNEEMVEAFNEWNAVSNPSL